ncbi:patatin-like phospholipase family protein [Actibacterium pelagium]|uniref:Alpha/beta hydrolase n=1 Tax=Actibacterium pelagium TaxID=2029103 RepID=A0A917EJ23_9RHOB|nr:patatin-like phospholipase family protein [Actibacterium pelagium]GGE42786.1 alpha/beta hydrolase [Actibacterium pelagium]
MAPKPINLALQGGGAHGAFTWGVLDRLLESDEVEIAAMSCTSAGALNGAAVKAGLALGSKQTAQDKLDSLWHQIGANSDPHVSRYLRMVTPHTSAVANALETSPLFQWGDFLSRSVSPYSWGPFYENPLRRIVEGLVCEELIHDEGPRFCICATNVRTGKIKVFDHERLTVDSILASACLPSLFQAVEIQDPDTGTTEAYWDGGYTGNPALFPLFEPDLPQDIVIVNINPLYREQLPVTPQQIQNRINEISFNSSLLRELRAISFVKRLLEQGQIENNSMKNVLIHMITDDELMNDLSVATKLVPIPYMLDRLKEAGRKAADGFLNNDVQNLGRQDSVDIHDLFA